MRELIHSVTKDDFQIEFTRGSGKGGQNRNKVETAVRMRHFESGAEAYCCDERSQLQNKKKAFERLVNSEKFKKWHRIKIAEVCGRVPTREELERQVDEEIERGIKNGTIKIEVF